ncbi:MAG TPA: hypothetical protein VJ399_03225 [Patescibacteria group bacterium]|nr:hypothetical protein [Patescibacteria group bacterium]
MSEKFTLKGKHVASIFIILLIIVLANFINFRISERKARDNQRNLDVSAIAQGLESYKADYGLYPLSSSEGKIIACKGPDTRRENPFEIPKNKKPKLINLIPCEWGKDSLMDVTDINYPHYLSLIPKDPEESMGASYRYISDGISYQILGAFEGKDLIEYNKAILRRNVGCGIRICNFGKASLNTSLDKSP